MSWDLCRGGPKHDDEIGLVHPRVSFTSPKSLVPNIYIYIHTCRKIHIRTGAPGALEALVQRRETITKIGRKYSTSKLQTCKPVGKKGMQGYGNSQNIPGKWWTI